MYIGSIDTRIDYELIDYLANELKEFNFVFIGDVKRQTQSIFYKIVNKHINIYHFSSIKYHQINSYLSYAKVCIIPFIRNSLSQSILPNKIFEYSILEKPFVITNFNKQLRDLHSDILIGNKKVEFKNLIKLQMETPYDTNALKDFASKYDWEIISKKYKKFILSTLNQ